MKILITGANGFVGKNLTAQLKNQGYMDLCLYDIGSDEAVLEEALRDCRFVFHLAGANRPEAVEEFIHVNRDFTSVLIGKLEQYNNTCPVLACSSIQAENDTPYGKSKKAMEDVLFAHEADTAAPVYVYRLPNIFGKWCRPNYNSVVATFCYSMARDIPVRIDNPDTVLRLLYIDDLIRQFIGTLEAPPQRGEVGFCDVSDIHTITLGELYERLCAYADSRTDSRTDSRADRCDIELHAFDDELNRKLYATFISYLPESGFVYRLDRKCDQRGYFCECLKCPEFGQVSVSVSKPGVTRGNHWHHSKTEKFLVLKGKAAVRFRMIGSDKVIEYIVTDESSDMLYIPAGYTHSIENIGEGDLILLIWCDEIFDPKAPDTYMENV